MPYAAKTDVSIDRSEGEIKTLLRRHRADSIGTREEGRTAHVAFRLNGRNILFTLTLPDPYDDAFRRTDRGNIRASGAAEKAWEQACRSRWRGLLLCIRAKLESVESGIETFEEAFLAQTVLPTGRTVFEEAAPSVAAAYRGNDVPLLPDYSRSA